MARRHDRELAQREAYGRELDIPQGTIQLRPDEYAVIGDDFITRRPEPAPPVTPPIVPPGRHRRSSRPDREEIPIERPPRGQIARGARRLGGWALWSAALAGGGAFAVWAAPGAIDVLGRNGDTPPVAAGSVKGNVLDGIVVLEAGTELTTESGPFAGQPGQKLGSTVLSGPEAILRPVIVTDDQGQPEIVIYDQGDSNLRVVPLDAAKAILTHRGGSLVSKAVDLRLSPQGGTAVFSATSGEFRPTVASTLDSIQLPGGGIRLPRFEESLSQAQGYPVIEPGSGAPASDKQGLQSPNIS